MKKLVALLLAIIMVLGVAACSQQTADTDKEPSAAATTDAAADTSADVSDSEEKVYKIGFAWASMDSNMEYLLNHIIENLKARTDMSFEFVTTCADSNTTKHISDVEDLVARECDLIYIMPEDADGIAPAVDYAIDAGVLVGVGRAVSTDSYTFRYQACENTAPGEMQAEYLIDYANEHPDETFYVAYVGGVSTNQTAKDRHDGFYNTVMDANCANIVWVTEQNCEYSTEQAQSTTEAWLAAHPEINTIACANDDMALGVVNAFVGAGVDDYLLFGIDGAETGLKMVSEGDMTMTVRMDNDRNAQGVAESIVKALNGTIETVGEVKLAYGGTKEDFYVMIDASNVGDYLN